MGVNHRVAPLIRLMLGRALSWLFGWPLALAWWASGWRMETGLPRAPRLVVVGAPHTSTWDFFHMLPIALLAGRRPHVAIKHTVFRPPLGAILRALGGIPIDRRRSHDVVAHLAARLSAASRMILIFTPEGTRRPRAQWKSGFYHTARAAAVPIALVYIDYQRKRVGCALTFYPSSDIQRDFALIRAVYAARGYPRYPTGWRLPEIPS